VTADDCADLRDRLAGLLDAIDPARHPDAHTALALALDSLIEPTSPPTPWQPRYAADDIPAALAQARTLARDALNRPHPLPETLAIAEAARYLGRAQALLARDEAAGGRP